jgi:cytochrome c biogenesis protein CcdA
MKAVLALVSFVITVVSIYIFRNYDYEWVMYVAILGGIGTIVFGGIYFAGRVNKKGDLHIAE